MIDIRPTRLRGALREVATAGPELGLAVTCLLALLVPEIEKRFAPKIGLLLGMEFIGLHAFAFLGRLAVSKPTERWQKILRVPAFLALCVIYSLVVYDWGADAVVAFWIVTLSTYAGFFFHDAPEQRIVTLTWRWGIAFGLFFAVAIVTGLTAEFLLIRSPRKELLFGFVFFTALGGCDVAHVYDRLAHRFTPPTAKSSA